MPDIHTETLPVNYNVPDAAIAELAERFQGLTAETTDKYKVVTKAISEVRTLRVGVEGRRKELKRVALDYGKRVDDEAKRITAALREVEDPLKEAKAEIDDEKARVKAEEEAKEKERVDEIQAKINGIGSALIGVSGKDADTMRGALAELEWNEPTEEEYGEFLQQAFQVRDEQIESLVKAVKAVEAFEAEQAELEIIQKKQYAEQAKLDAQRKKQEAEQDRLDAEKEKARLNEERKEIKAEAKETAEREAREKLEREAKEKDEKELADRLAEAKRIAELPDLESFHLWISADLTKLLQSVPHGKSERGKNLCEQIKTNLRGVERAIVEDLVRWEESNDG